jgi:S1-C subfamily serine protease/curved DNA-binding protein CbpA
MYHQEMGKTLYDLIGVARSATREEIEAAYLARVAAYSSGDSSGQNEAFRKLWLTEIERARSVLINDAERAAYDATLPPLSNSPRREVVTQTGKINPGGVDEAPSAVFAVRSFRSRLFSVLGWFSAVGLVAVAGTYMAWQWKFRSDVQNSVKTRLANCRYISLEKFSFLDSTSAGGQRIARVRYTIRFTSPQPQAKQAVEKIPAEMAQQVKALEDQLQEATKNLAQVESRYQELTRRNSEMAAHLKREHAAAAARNVSTATLERERLFRDSQTIADREHKQKKSTLDKSIADYKRQIELVKDSINLESVREIARARIFDHVVAECPSADWNILRDLSGSNKDNGFLTDFDAHFNKDIALGGQGTTVASATESTNAAGARTGGGKTTTGSQDRTVTFTPEQIYARVSQSVGIVIVFDGDRVPVGQGSGVVVARRTMVTNKHVIERASSANRVGVLVAGVGHQVTDIRCDTRGRDLCLLVIPSLNAPAVEITATDNLVVGQPAYAVGAPREIQNFLAVYSTVGQTTDLQLTISAGIVSSLRRGEDGTIIQTTAPVSPGSSGGGLFDAHARLIGITTFKVVGGENLNMALPATWVSDLGV